MGVCGGLAGAAVPLVGAQFPRSCSRKGRRRPRPRGGRPGTRQSLRFRDGGAACMPCHAMTRHRVEVDAATVWCGPGARPFWEQGSDSPRAGILSHCRDGYEGDCCDPPPLASYRPTDYAAAASYPSPGGLRRVVLGQSMSNRLP